jgi:CPA1 family monovalent cation:H+ antiporter
MKPWHIVVAIAAGVVVGIFEPGRFEYALGHATLYVFLPPLLFEAAWNLSYRAIVRHWRAIAMLAGPGVVLTAVVVAGALTIVRVPIGPALLTGAILSATDPIAVIAIFRSFKIPKSLETIVECESLFNDAVAVVLYRGVLAALVAGSLSASSIGLLTARTVGESLGGVVLGVALAFVVARVLRRTQRVEPQILATILCAYGTYFAADELHMSGIFATIASGIALRYYERRWLTHSIVEGVERFWDLAALLANALVFFLVGAALKIDQIAGNPAFVIACLAATAVSRFALAWLLIPYKYPPQWLNVVRVAGVRGALSIALALAIPAFVPYRQAIVDATFAVALATIAAYGLRASRVVRRAAL